MKKILQISTLLTVLILLMTAKLAGQSPDLVNYQAIIRDATGEAITGTAVNISITILQGSSTGTVVYSETHNPTTNNFGLVGLEIGNGVTSDDFSSITWSGGPFFIKVDVDGNEMSVSQILSVPYAIYAAEAGNVFSGDYNDLSNKPFFITSESDPVFSGHAASTVSFGNISNWNIAFGWGNHALGNYLTSYTETDPLFNAAPAKNITPTNITNWNSAYGWGNHAVAGYLTSTNWIKDGDSLYYIGGNVGIGTKDPRSTLSVYGSTPNDTAIFEVKNNLGQTVFAVYNEGVRITIDETVSKGPRGGFAIGGFDNVKGTQEYFRVTGDSTRVYVNQNSSKGPRGGFAIGGFDGAGKGALYNFVNLTPENYLIGHSAGESITWGTKNIFMGYESGKSNASGSNNVFMGYRSGMNTTSSDNIMIGTEAGITNSTGLLNLFIGSGAGYNNLGGSTNVFMGYQAGYSNSSASGSVIIGEEAGFNNNASRNIFIGRSAGRANISGDDNVMVGSYSGKTMTNGRYNTFLGVEAGDFAEGGDGNVYLGHRTGYDNNGSGNVVIGDLAGSNVQNYSNPSTTYIYSVFVGRASGYNNTTGDYNVFLGMNSGFANQTGINNTYLGTQSGNQALGSGNVLIGYQAGYNAAGDNQLYIMNSSSSSPLIYGQFSNTLASQLLRVNGKMEIKSMDIGTGTTVVIDATGRLLKVSSSLRYKTDISDLEGKLADFMALRPVEFTWNQTTGTPGKRDFGFIAEEVDLIDSQLAVYNPDGSPEGVSYHNIGVLSVKVIQQQQKEIESLKLKQSENEKVIDDLYRRLLEAEQKINIILGPGK